jgi:pimeloyl-ACP methyl ester carboxylesterase
MLERAEYGVPAGVPVFYHPGTPSTAGAARLLDEPARAARVRLVSITRPGYAGSPDTTPGPASVGRRTVALADALGVVEFGVVGASGGGPYALACAAVAPSRVTRVVVLAGTAPGRAPAEDADAVAELRAEVDAMTAALAGLDEAGFVAAFARQLPPEERYLADRPEDLATFMADTRRALSSSMGLIRDNLSWGGAWDIDLSAVSCPVDLVYGGRDHMVPADEGRKLAALLTQASCTVLDDADHGTVIYGSAPRWLGLFSVDAQVHDKERSVRHVEAQNPGR